MMMDAQKAEVGPQRQFQEATEMMSFIPVGSASLPMSERCIWKLTESKMS